MKKNNLEKQATREAEQQQISQQHKKKFGKKMKEGTKNFKIVTI